MGVQQGCVSDEPQINPNNFLLTRVCSWCERLFSFHTSVTITVELRFAQQRALLTLAFLSVQQ